MTVLKTMWDKAVIVRIRARRVFVWGSVLACLVLVALPRALALDPERRISQYGSYCVAHPGWHHLSPYQYCINPCAVVIQRNPSVV
jgi:hypothetical protein